MLLLNIVKLEEVAKESGKSFSFLSEKVLGKYRTFLKDVKAGKAKLSLEQQQLLVEDLNVSIEWLNDETDIKEKATAKSDGLTNKEMKLLNIFRSLSEDEQDLFLKMFSSNQE